MTIDPAIRVGDVVHDLVERGHMRVLEHKGTVAEYRTREDFNLAEYKTHPLLGITDDEDVWRCVYLSSDPTISYGQSYAFPESRLARAPVEEAASELDRPYHSIQRALLATLFAACPHDGEREVLDVITDAADLDPDLVEAARELAEAATITADTEEVDS